MVSREFARQARRAMVGCLILAALLLSLSAGRAASPRLTGIGPSDSGSPARPPEESPGPRILVHLSTPVTEYACPSGLLADCRDAVVTGRTLADSTGPVYYAYLLLARGSLVDLGGLLCGISYQGDAPGAMSDGRALDIFAWHACVYEPGPPTSTWPEAGSSKLLAWSQDDCQTGGVAVAGYFYLGAYDPDTLRITVDHLSGTAEVADCQAGVHQLAPGDLGFVVFSPDGGAAGCNPCLDDCPLEMPALGTTWGGIKALFR